MLPKLLERLAEKEERMIEIRRHLHMYPEVSFAEKNTAKYIAAFYNGLDAEVQTNIGGYGVLVTIKGAEPGKTIAIRADFDASPITEESGVPFSSKNIGVMHACGHDGHTAAMLILAETLIEMKEQIRGTVKIIHQHAGEVSPGGALDFIAAGALDNVDGVFASHIIPSIPTGVIAYREGCLLSGRANFKLTIQGKGEYSSTSHLTNDTIVAGSYFVTAIQNIVSRRISPFDMATVSISSFDGKGTANIAKDTVVLEGDVRTMSEDNRHLIEKEFRAIVKGIEEQFDVEAHLHYHNDYPVVMNHRGMTKLVVDGIKRANIVGIHAVVESAPQQLSEDLGYYLQNVPGSYFFVGGKPENDEVYPPHHPKFVINEKCLLYSAETMGAVVAAFLN